MVTAFKDRNTLCKVIEAKVSIANLQEAMANQSLLFGDKNTADVRLNLIDSAGVEYPGNPLLLHSQVLKKSEFLETKLSQSGSSAKRPFEIKVTCSYHPETYIKCIQLMYSYDTDQCFNFTHVDEALTILPVASEVMFRDCMESCMRYLAAVRWCPEQEAKLPVLLSSLNINVLPDLAARLGMSQSKSDCEDIKMLKESLQELLQNTDNNVELRSIVEQHIFDYFKLNTSPAINVVCSHVILKRFRADVKAIKSKSDERSMRPAACSDLCWLLGVIRRCDSKLFATVVKEFCEDVDLRNAVAGGAIHYYSALPDMLTILIDQILKAMENGEIITTVSFRVDFLTKWAVIMVKLLKVVKEFCEDVDLRNAVAGGAIHYYSALPDMLTILIDQILKAMENGEIITTVSFRVDFLTKWAVIMVKLLNSLRNYVYDDTASTFQSALETGIIGVGETLPLVEQKRIYSFWQDIFTKNSMSTNSLFKWWAQKLHDAIMLHKI